MKKVIIILLLILILFSGFVSSIGYASPSITDFELVVHAEETYEITYHLFDETYEYQMNDQELSGEEAKPEVESFIFSLGLTQDLQDEQVKLKVLDKLQLSEKEVKDFSLELTFDGGKSQTVK
ncbi:hypothetical protein JCM19037_1213 [Geomicrobium sp. JCM 19037]|uniref:YusW family protein n=1 Tax=Geomicrobium sp. JCM 19037 TaxID=1460634 RepID=UPI00045F2082|nr:YusW family protein [Geomicrobium sp. JCM 19037]GAK02943.1 hypothetical protein JCM19037_1213 [Geomicrobium sp. JCM 19037]